MNVHPTDCPAPRALEVRGDIVPVPVGKITEPQAAIMMAATALRAKAINEDSLKAVVPFHGTGPISEEVCGLATPRHAH